MAPRLPFGEVAFVPVFVELVREIEPANQRDVADDRWRRRDHGAWRKLGPRVDLDHGLPQDLAHGDVAVIGVGALDDVPRGRGNRRLAQHLLPFVVVPVVVLQRRLVDRRDAPARLPAGFQLAQALLLRRAGKMDPELEQDDALVGEHLLVLAHLLQSGVELRVRHLMPHVRVDQLPVPRVHEDAEAPARRQRAPVAPCERTRFLFRRAGTERAGADESRIHPFVELVRGFAAPAALQSADQHQDRAASRFGHFVLPIEQRLAQLGFLARIGGLGDSVADFRRFEHCVLR